jgi:hypothetical protein
LTPKRRLHELQVLPLLKFQGVHSLFKSHPWHSYSRKKRKENEIKPEEEGKKQRQGRGGEE